MASAPRFPVHSSERGIALIAALLVLVMSSILGVTFVATVVSERDITSNVQVARQSLLAADAGVRSTQQRLANTVRAKLDSALNIYPGSGLILTQPGNIFPSGNILYSSSSNPTFSSSATVAWADTNVSVNTQTYIYRYTITATGKNGFWGERAVQSTGFIQVSADRSTFAQFLLFTNQQTTASGGAIWLTSSSQFDGRAHTNTQFRFSYQPTFTDLVTQVYNKAWYYNKGDPKELAANYNGTIDVPAFGGGFMRNAPTVSLPTNSYSQQNASLGRDPTSSTPPTNSEINQALLLGSGSSAPPNDVYIVHNSSNQMTGGIYIQGTVDRVLATADTINRKQVYTITMGSTVKTITIDKAANTTSVKIGSGSPTVYTGVPLGITYCKGTISDLRGPDRTSGVPNPALLNDQQMLFATTGDIVLTRDLIVEDYATATGVCGLYSSGGDVRIGTSAPNDCNVDAFVMATGGGVSGEGVFTVDNYNSGSPRGTFHLRGGVVTQYYGPFFTFNSSGTLLTGMARDFRFDRRGFVPPYFPTTNLFVRTNTPSARTMAWKEL